MKPQHIGSLRVSALCLGTLPFGKHVDERTSFAILDRFVAAGGTFLDTANNYVFWDGGTGDESEETIGRWLAARGNRDDVVIATKLGARPRTPGAGLEDAEGLSGATVRRAAEDSLKRLGTDRIDLYYSHVEDRSVPLEDTLGGFAALVEAGAVREIGASNHATWRLERARAVSRANGWPLYTAVQQRYSYLRPRPHVKLPEWAHVHMTEELFDYAKTEGDVALLAYSPLLSGAYRDKPLGEGYHHPGTTRRLAVLHEIAAELGATVNQVVLAWLVRQGVTPIVGASSVAQLDESLGAFDLELDDDQVARLDGAA
ncbi:aryl-alcohol dehydrogenase-like predicted oxidoreductase [Saccharothrix tamanrassetensis]|uniref:Aryl-alcohol dehydrogenase-like predicted oxidoreductase n=1 Tax=Saccharothrix tamanrassetensis TaxID=1051531 RepID=A0A841CV34_9PSEU|nr:aldo/keto reductase [Saccharothrix tamanrassetensis]MBB5959266.1 aryl-alcohol dehydrogenase-like predicted oxidoreductase [Saccharothrix tamanrassetensis]